MDPVRASLSFFLHAGEHLSLGHHKKITVDQDRAYMDQFGSADIATERPARIYRRFMRTSGIGLEIGGGVQHGAIIAREYGLLRVSGMKDATAEIRDGQLSAVDGSYE